MAADLSLLDLACIVTALLVSLPSVRGAAMAWWTGDLGPGGHRPEPAIAALLANSSWLVYGCIEHLWEPILLNAEGSLVQGVSLLVFLDLSDQEQLEATIIAIFACLVYFAPVLVVGLSINTQLNILKGLCTLAGSVAAAAPLLTYYFLHENPNAEVLPSPGFLGFNTLNCLLWTLRGFILKDCYMATQNGLGMVSSLIQLNIVLRFPQPNQEDHQGLLADLLADQPAQESAVQPEEVAQEPVIQPVPEEMQQAQGEIQPQAVPEEMQQAEGELQPPAVLEEMQQAQGELQPAQEEILPGDDDDEEPGSGEDDDEEPGGGGGGGDHDNNVVDDDDDEPDEQVPVLPRRSARIAAIIAAAAAAANH